MTFIPEWNYQDISILFRFDKFGPLPTDRELYFPTCTIKSWRRKAYDAASRARLVEDADAENAIEKMGRKILRKWVK